MKTLVVYFSKFGNTQLVAKTIADHLVNQNGNGNKVSDEVRTIDCDKLDATQFKNVDLVVMGTPTHNMNLPKVVSPIFKALPKRCLKGVKYAVFDTSYEMNWFFNKFTAAKRLSQKLRKLGGKPVLPPQTFIVLDREGPLGDGELNRAVFWADEIVNKMS